MIIETRAVEPFFKNGYVVGCEATREAVVIDPGDEVEQLIEVVEKHRLAVKYILLTHAHMDHITGVGRAKEAFGAPIGLHEADNFLYEGVVQQGMMFGFRVEPQPKVDFFYDSGLPGARTRSAGPRGPWRFGTLAAWVHHTPGHCPGGVCLAVGSEDENERTLFVGDTLFAGSIGRTDLPGGDYDTLIASIRNVLLAFADETPVYAGHGEPTTIGRERQTNPFLL